MPTLKVFVAGLPGAGKTETIKSASDLPLVSVEKKIIGTSEIHVMDYGRVYLPPIMLYFYANTHGEPPSTVWTRLRGEMQALLFLYDGTVPEQAVRARKEFTSCISDYRGAVVIGVSKVDDPQFSSSVYDSAVEAAGPRCAVLPYAALQRDSVRVLVDEIIRSLSNTGGLAWPT